MPRSYSLIRIFGNSLIGLMVWSGFLLTVEGVRPNSTLATRLSQHQSIQTYLWHRSLQ